MTKEKKKIERICKTCKLFNPVTHECSIFIIFEGKKVKLPVLPEDTCFFEEQMTSEYETVKDNKKQMVSETFSPIGEVKQVRFWEDKDSGDVKIEYPEGFFGTEDPDDYSEE